MSGITFMDCGCPPSTGTTAHNLAPVIGYVFYCNDCHGFLTLQKATIDTLIETLTRLRDGQPVDLSVLTDESD